MRLFALLFAVMTWSSQVEAEVFDDSFRLSQIKGVHVFLWDNAKGACWTNLREVREYAEEKLRMKGAKLVDPKMLPDMEQVYTLAIEVTSKRLYKNGTGACWGYTHLGLMTGAMIHGSLHAALIAEKRAAVREPANLNRHVIDRVSEFIAEFK